MTHSRPMADSEGDFGGWMPSRLMCKCGSGSVEFRKWESSCGGYEDYQYRCKSCGNVWWVEGPDA